MVRRLFPWLTDRLRAVPDPRQPDLCTYSNASLLWTGILLFLSRLGARRQVRFRLQSPPLLQRMELLSGQRLAFIPHGDTLDDYLSRLGLDDLRTLPSELVRRLLETRRLEDFRLLGKFYLVGVDLTGHLFLGDRPSPFTEGCLTQTTEDGKTLYYRPVCEAKLLTRTGLALSIASEFVENVPRNNRTDSAYKQDCELKAFHRILPTLKQAFPRTEFCLLLDSLYANQPVFSLCERFGWKYIITLKEGSLPSVAREFYALRPLAPENRFSRILDDVRYEYSWVNAIPYEGHLLNVLLCECSYPDGQTVRFLWVTNIPVTHANCCPLAQDGGRQRWRIENEGFRTQKHAGFEMEHAYAKRPNAAKQFYFLLQIAHLLAQLFECYCHGKLSVKQTYGSLRNLAHLLLESFRRDPLPEPDALRDFLEQPVQIPLNSS